MENLGKKLMLGGSVAAMLAAISAGADAQDQQAQNVENVTVSASRISIQGYEAPTPVTVIGAETLQRDAKVDIGDAIRELPAVGQSDSPSNGSHAGNASQGDAGIDTVDLRSLGVVRTLVLFDGQRVVTSNPNAGGPPAIGGVDLSTIPTSIIQRIDVVTGGASASWGSDAVAGVVNLVIDKTYTGFKANAVFGNDKNDDQKKWKLEATAGWDFLGDRGHTEFAANYTMSPDTLYAWNRPWFDNNNRALYPCNLVNPGSGSATALCHTPSGVYSNSFTNGGLITANPAGATGAALTAIQAIGGQFATAGSAGAGAANAYKGIQFVGPNAQQVPFNFGVSSGGNCYACSGNPNSDLSNQTPLAVPYHNYNLFNYTSYKITPDITASVMLNYGWNAEENIANNGRQSQVTVKVDNAFIPAQLQQQLIASGIPSFSLGTAAIENLQNDAQVSMRSLSQSIAQNFVQNYRQLMRGVFTLKGNYHLFGEDWSWNAYAQNSSVRERQYAPYNTMNQNFSNAVDSVVVQATGPNSLGGGNAATATAVRNLLTASGVPIPAVGSIACRSTLTSTAYGVVTSPTSGFQVLQSGGLAPGCVPLNLFGDGTVSQAALNYIAPGRINPADEDEALYRIGQSVFSVSTQGVLPWGLPAGKPAIAFGFEDRLEQQRNQRDPLQLGASGVFESGNFSQYAGEYNVQEGFLELDVPLLKNDFVDDLNFNAAGRITSYSTSGLVETWKLGLTSQLNEDIKVRTTLSSDIRAPGIGELFTNTLVSTQTLSFPNGGPTFNVHQLQGGNPLLSPEQAETVEGGIVLTPHWIENLSMSFDWYSITLHNGIFAPTEAQIASQCSNGIKVAAFCQLLFFGRGFPGNSSLPVGAEVDGNGISPPPALLAAIGNTTFSADSEGAFNAYLQSPVNANRETTSGLDFQLDYSHELFEGEMNWHILGNYTDEKTRTSLGVTVDGAGAVSADGSLNPLTGFTEPKLRATITSTYAEGPWSITGQARIIGAAVLTNNLTQSQAVFTSIDNNDVPAVIYGDFRGSYRWNDHIQLYGAVDNAFNAPPPNIPTIGGGGENCIIYDCIGRAYRIGVRFDD